jgi:hypothetical protein
MPFLAIPEDPAVFEVWGGLCGTGVCFRLAVFFWAAALRSEGSGVGAVCGTGESCEGEVSSGKVMLHVMSLETKKFSLAGR